MKMIIPIKATESGKITNNLSPGSVINAGDLLATLELKDPSKVKKIATFDGTLAFPNTPLDTDAKDLAAYLLAGYKVSASSFIYILFSTEYIPRLIFCYALLVAVT